MSTMSNGFGRRPVINREGLKSIQQEPAVAQGDSEGASLSLPKPVLGLLLGFGVIALLFGTHVAAMKGFGRALDQHWAQNVGYPEVDDAFKRSGSADRLLEQVHNNCKSQSDFVGRNTPHTMNDVVSADGISIGRAVTYLSCLATENPARFCQALHRGHLLAAVKDYYRLKAKMREEQVFMNAGPFAANRNALMGGPSREAFPSTSPLTLESDTRVIVAMKALVAGGYLSRRELIGATGGWPNDLEVALRGGGPKQRGCA
jgi:hypothetical protein